jgi:hypothetical protein
MRSLLISATAAVLVAASGTASLAAVKEVPYPVINVKLADTYTPDAAFQQMQNALAQVSANKDADGLFTLVGPTFLWMSRGEPSDQFDFGRGALDNFKAVFGFGEPEKNADDANSGKAADSAAPEGPFWDVLAAFATDNTLYAASDSLVCGPTRATIVDEDDFDSAKKKIRADDSVEWYFTLADTTATSTPSDAGLPVGRVGQVALPVLSVFPRAPQGQPQPAVTYLQVLLPSGKSGWIPASAALPLVTDRLCYAFTPDGWRIAAFDQSSD